MLKNTRRDFIKQAALGTPAFMAYPRPRVLGANERIRLAMIGVGLRGHELLRQTLALPNAQVVAVADVYTRRFDEARKISPGLQTVGDYRRILDMKDIDGVLVASPLHIHARHFLDTLAAGKDLYSGKTMTWSIAEAESLRTGPAHPWQRRNYRIRRRRKRHGHRPIGRRGPLLPGRCESPEWHGHQGREPVPESHRKLD